MNWKLIIQLSLFGLAMAFATVFWIPTKVEPIFWLIIFITCAYIIAKKCSGKYFLHGFLVSMANCVWITIVHAYFFETYIMNHIDIALMNMNMPMADSPRLLMSIMGAFIGAASGLILGSFSFIGAKLAKK